MKIRYAVLAGAALLACSAWAQTDLVAPPPPPPPPPGADSADKVMFFKVISDRAGMDAQPVKGAPYSADQTTSTVQTLGDGNRIVQTSTAKVYRDEQGRSRVEQSLGGIGAMASSEKHTMIMIHDPVAGVEYNLDPGSHTAHKFSTNDPDSAKVRVEKMAMDRKQVFFSSRDRLNDKTGVVTYKVDRISDAKTTKEDLGSQMMEGLSVTGTRTTTTIPAGAEGNEQPMLIVDEVWYSPELQTTIKTFHSDPRMGQTVFTVTNVNRTNPDPSLFQVPADYKISGGAPPQP